jgi:hypothetical protein
VFDFLIAPVKHSRNIKLMIALKNKNRKKNVVTDKIISFDIVEILTLFG